MKKGEKRTMTKYVVDASPTKEFFIYMLTRDIDLRAAVVELIDNAIDGAKRLRSNNDYKGLYIKLELSKDRFVIEDNCGGIDIETAVKYAFKFGRDSKRPNNVKAYFTGIFGIGMKRTLFKLGRKFNVVSTTKNEHFDLNVDVDEWIKDSEWTFQNFETKKDLNNEENQTGTKIIVDNLNEEVAARFENKLFMGSLIDYIQRYRTVEAENGLEIIVNDHTIDYGNERLIESKNVKIYKNKVRDKQGDITIVAGITSKGSPKKAGWYIYCNGRLVVYADKTSLTGWGDGIKQFHNDVAEFRGYVYFESNDLLALPWNTTKTGVDSSNRLYIIAREKMIEATDQILKTITETKKKYDVTDLEKIDFIKKAPETKLTHTVVTNITSKSDFVIEDPVKPIPMSTITITKPAEEVEKVREHMGEKTKKAVGEKLFEYYCEMEGL